MSAERTIIELSDESVDRIARRVIELQGGSVNEPTLSTEDAMKGLGYQSRKRFWQAVRRLGIPYARLSPRHCVFRRSDIDAVLRQRQVGRVARRVAIVANGRIAA